MSPPASIKLRSIVLCLFVFASFTKADVLDEVIGITKRLLGEQKAGSFVLSVNRTISVNERDTFVLKKDNSTNGKVLVAGSSGVAATWGVYYYLTKYCGCHISWDGDQLQLPDALPDVDITISAIDKYKYYQNVCTTSYSFVWWDWPRWERELDWMALNGVNLALAFGGQEAIWQRVFDGLQVASNFTGPAFLSWLRMGNMRAFGGGLSSAWHQRSVELQHRILDRMRILGITPVLPAFSGVLPPSFKTTFPLSTGSYITQWNSLPPEYCCPFLLSPSDPLFAHVARLFLREYIGEFGTDHIYNVDTFNENDPDSNDPGYIADTARAIFDGITEVDPAAIWMLQGWMFLYPFWTKELVKAYVTSVPIGKMLILDLQSDLTPLYDQFESYFGQPFIWCTLHNFGGQTGLYGHLEKVNRGIIGGRNLKNSTMVGLGLTPEGINQNYIMYDFTFDGATENNERNLTTWISDYISRRYGFVNTQVDEAWQILKRTVYDYNLSRKSRGIIAYDDHIAKSVFTKLPSLSMTEVMWYDRSEVYNAFLLMVSAAATDPKAKTSPLFAHDLVDVTRQTVQLAVGLLYAQAVQQYKSRDAAGLNKTAETMVNLMSDLDDVLKTNEKFLLGSWLESAKAAASTPEEAKQFEWNARNQITLWGPAGEIRDYASKQWSGMVSNYYKPRWETFLNALRTDLAGGAPYNRTAVDAQILNNVEIPFTMDQSSFPAEPLGNTIEVVLRFNSTWGSLADTFASDVMKPQPIVIGLGDMIESGHL